MTTAGRSGHVNAALRERKRENCGEDGKTRKGMLMIKGEKKRDESRVAER